MIRRGTKVGAVLSAAHRAADGGLHGHSWLVWATFVNAEVDALLLQARLRKVLESFDHTILGDEVARGEALAAVIGILLGCDRVDVERPLELISAWWER